MGVIEGILNILAPHECLRCKTEGSLLCKECATVLVAVLPRCYRCKRWCEGSRTCERCRPRSPLSQVWSVASYDDVVAKELVRVLKFGRAKGAASAMASPMATNIGALKGVHITYVPTANSRTRERGYDQAELLAKELSRQTGLPYTPLLARVGEQRQTGQKREARTRQMQDAFRTLNPEMARNRHVLLVDDVLTTGATCEAAARTLRQAGAKSVSAAVFAVA